MLHAGHFRSASREWDRPDLSAQPKQKIWLGRIKSVPLFFKVRSIDGRAGCDNSFVGQSSAAAANIVASQRGIHDDRRL